MQWDATPTHIALQFRHIMEQTLARGCPVVAVFVFRTQASTDAQLVWLVAHGSDPDIRAACIRAASQASPHMPGENENSSRTCFRFSVPDCRRSATCVAVEIAGAEQPGLCTGMIFWGEYDDMELVSDGLHSCALVVRSFSVAHFGNKAGHEIEFLGISPEFRRLFEKIVTIGACDPMPVLISGERGSGKEAVALALHYYSKRRYKPFLSINCAALTDQLCISELFGCYKGAYTGADRDRKGKFALANGGMLFLDEITEVPPSVTASLLRALDRGEIQPLGAVATFCVDVRVIAATNKDIDALISRGAFAADMFDRLAMFQINVPSLRERHSDIAILAAYFAQKYCQRRDQVCCWEKTCFGPHGSGCISEDALKILQEYAWPGNVRELRNVIAQSITDSGGPVGPAFIPEYVIGLARKPVCPAESLPTLSQATKEHIEQALRKTGGNKSAAARLLGLPLSTLVSKMRKLSIGYSDSPEAPGSL